MSERGSAMMDAAQERPTRSRDAGNVITQRPLATVACARPRFLMA